MTTSNLPNTSFVLRGVEDVIFEEKPVPEIGDRDVLVEVKKTGICGSDVHYLVHGRIAHFVVEKPMVLGHESAGIVAQVGSKVTHLRVGDRVALEPGESCGTCNVCKQGKYELCEDMMFAATPPYDGTLGRYYKLPAHLAYPIPDSMSLEDGAMIEPLAVGVHSVSTLAQVKANQTVAVFGAGPVGLLCMAVAKALGAKRVIAIDIAEDRLKFAQTYAATDGFLPPKLNEGEERMAYSQRATNELMKALKLEERGPNAVDVVVCIQMGLFLVTAGGTYVQVGMGAPEVKVPITLLLTKELVVKGSFRYGPGAYQLAISLVAAGKIDLKPLVTHRFDFTDATKAFQTTRAGKSEDGKGVIKVIISGPE